MNELKNVAVAVLVFLLVVIAYDLHRVANAIDGAFGPAALRAAANYDPFKDWTTPQPAPTRHPSAPKSK